ncbi:LacI family DNA-binding transcriptional regulator [Pedobacter cryophilus]|uniref:LacI family transcriptional regulator n=1 Tax=Pedobacter cryophilus TaxID=2571271 RepID=A0A4U1BTD7_9SPHI|nr:LacI family DNA-binding transcriptional regulator [Pedobacter cryophilus]TKB95715.1 LacI family transcriptional regulator [Pedobacter cryophilus]
MNKKEKEVTIYDIAKKLNISASTVSRGLNNDVTVKKETQKKVQSVAKQMGYRLNSLASNLRSKKSNTIGVIVPRLNSNFMADVIAGIEKVVNEGGYNLIISQSLETMEKEIINTETMFNNRVDGLLVSTTYNTNNIDHFEALIKKGVPVIFFDRVFDHTEWPTIRIDNFKAAYDATSHLIKQGSKNLFHISGNQTTNVYTDRFKGFKQALIDHHIIFDEANLLVTDLSTGSGEDVANYMLALPKLPDGVFSANDQCAVSCMQSLQKAGIKIPKDIAFVGFNNDTITKVIEPNLSTIDYKGSEMGEVAARVLINHLNGTDIKPAHSIILRSELLIRESSLRN